MQKEASGFLLAFMGIAMNKSMKYWIELDRLKDVPGHFQLRAEKRFLLIKEFEAEYDTERDGENGKKTGKVESIRKFCEKKDLHLSTFYKWQKRYHEQGIKGLIPRWGYRKWKPANAEFIPNSLEKRKRSNNRKRIITRVIIDPQRPLQCLSQIRSAINKSTCVSRQKKKVALGFLDTINKLLVHRDYFRIDPPLSAGEIRQLKTIGAGSHKNSSLMAEAILMMNSGEPAYKIRLKVGRAPYTIFHAWRKKFNKDRLKSLDIRRDLPGRLERMSERKAKVFGIIHSPPSDFGINRTTWTHPAIRDAYIKTYGETISTATISRIVKGAGYSWQHARMVLTSPDPKYRDKIAKLLETLRGMKETERFFFIDEAGPWKAKKYGGKALVQHKSDRNIPEPKGHKRKGSVQFIVALEAISNQVTWHFTEAKNTTSLLSLVEELAGQYKASSRLYFTWDALTVHSSRAVERWLEKNNKKSAAEGKIPQIVVVPLPAKAQFLNVVESVISGMKKAVIVNSDYPTAEHMKKAIAEHFAARNRHFKDNPKRAGHKIWDASLFDPETLPGGLYRKM